MTGPARWAAALALAAGAACSDLTSVASGPASLAIDSLPFPSVVVGDTLRDTLGVVRNVTARVFDGANTLLTNQPVRFFALDTGVVLDSLTGRLVGRSRRSSVRVVASLGTLQTAARTLAVANRPDTASAPDAVTPMLYVTVPRTDAANTRTIRVKVGSLPVPAGTSTADSLVEGWLVRFALTRTPTVVDSVFLAGGVANTPWAITDASGVASKTFRILPKLGSRTKDTAIVQATVTYKGAPVKGSPVQLVIPLSPRDST